jgi:hypothetical protein
MRSDALLSVIPPGFPLSLVAGAGVAIASQVLDLLGQGVGTAPANSIGTAALFGTDFGVGDDRLLLDVVTGAALVTATAATLNLAFQGAPDLGVTGNYQPGTWQTFVETGPLTAAQCPASTRIARFDWPPAFPEGTLPRYVRLLAQVPAGTDFTAGSIAYAIATTARDDWSAKYAAKNYRVA